VATNTQDTGLGLARSTDPDTSRDAAASTDVRGSRAEVLRILTTFGPMSDDELQWRHENTPNATRQYTPQRLRTARKSLERDGLVVLTGKPAMTRYHRAAQEWAVAS
jgi:hypothetical protein